MAFKIKRVVYDDVAISLDDLVTIGEAATILGMSFEGVVAAMDRGQLTEFVNEDAIPYRKGRRMVLKSELASFGERKKLKYRQ